MMKNRFGTERKLVGGDGMPTGAIINALAIVAGGILGDCFGNKLSDPFKENLNLIFGICAMTMGISGICLMENMPAVVFSTIIGTSLGLAFHLGEWIQKGAGLMQKGISAILKKEDSAIRDDVFTATLITGIVLFCASGTGIYGSIVAGMDGDHSILIAKAILDLPTALIFSCSLGAVVAMIAIPQFAISLLLFLLARVIYPLTTPAMINDFKACGGILLLATGFRIMKVKEFPVADMIPSMVLAMPVSWLWVHYILPLVR